MVAAEEAVEDLVGVAAVDRGVDVGVEEVTGIQEVATTVVDGEVSIVMPFVPDVGHFLFLVHQLVCLEFNCICFAYLMISRLVGGDPWENQGGAGGGWGQGGGQYNSGGGNWSSDNFGGGYQQNYGGGPVRGNFGGSGGGRPSPYSGLLF